MILLNDFQCNNLHQSHLLITSIDNAYQVGFLSG